MGCDAYPGFFVDLDAMDIRTRGRQHTRDSAPFSLPVFAKLKRPVAFTMRMTREVPLVTSDKIDAGNRTALAVSMRVRLTKVLPTRRSRPRPARILGQRIL